jgi:hypothetical protein
MIQLPNNLKNIELEIEKEFKEFNSDKLSLEFQFKCVNFVISVLKFLLNNFNELNLEDYFEFLGSYYIAFLHNNKGKEINGLVLVHDMDPITDVFLEIQNLEKPYKKSDVKKIIIWLNKFLIKN